MALQDERAQANQFDVVLGQRIRGFRRKHGMSRKKLAAQLDLSIRGLQRYEQGSRRMPPDMLVRLATVLDVKISSFFAD